jgi:hypothetical protein
MWNKFLCWWLGHKTMIKGYTGEKSRVLHPMGHEYDVNFYKWERQRYCLRCGKEIWKEVA